MRAPRITSEGADFVSAPARLEYPFDAAPAPGESREVLPGLHWLRMPLPIQLDHINLWLFEEPQREWSLVDTGMAAVACTDTWERVLPPRRLGRIVLTHFHPDHMGLAGWLQAGHGDGVVLSSRRTFESWRRMVDEPPPDVRHRQAQFLEAHGLAGASEKIEHMRVLGRHAELTRTPRVGTWLADGDQVELGGYSWQCLEVHGHADGHLCLYCAEAGVLIGGDQVLPTISPNVGLAAWHWGRDVLGDYLDSLDRLAALPSDTLVLPSHGRPFRGLPARLADLQTHHEQELAGLAAALDSPQRAFELIELMYGRVLRGVHVLLGLHECIAHLERLVATGRATREGDFVSGFRYRRASARVTAAGRTGSAAQPGRG